jgi:hypothetical protein
MFDQLEFNSLEDAESNQNQTCPSWTNGQNDFEDIPSFKVNRLNDAPTDNIPEQHNLSPAPTPTDSPIGNSNESNPTTKKNNHSTANHRDIVLIEKAFIFTQNQNNLLGKRNKNSKKKGADLFSKINLEKEKKINFFFSREIENTNSYRNLSFKLKRGSNNIDIKRFRYKMTKLPKKIRKV